LRRTRSASSSREADYANLRRGDAVLGIAPARSRRPTATELDHGEHVKIALAAEEPLTPWPWVRTSFVWRADRAVNQREARNGGVRFEDLGVDERGENDLLFGTGSNPGSKLSATGVNSARLQPALRP
jgi:hypothetical protein